MLSRWASREWGGSSFGHKLFTLRIGMAQRPFLSWTRVGGSGQFDVPLDCGRLGLTARTDDDWEVLAGGHRSRLPVRVRSESRFYCENLFPPVRRSTWPESSTPKRTSRRSHGAFRAKTAPARRIGMHRY